ncbi:MAG: hypothetical protein HPY53_01315 [Brevinematales bacterium]|nr:hypothetical protein [Brevinematales bacterium]
MRKILSIFIFIIALTINTYPKTGEVTIIPNSYADAVLFTSVNAPVEGENRPILILLTGNCYLPGEKWRTVNMKGAMLLGYTEGVWNSEFVQIKLINISYVDFKGDSHVEDISGFVTDEFGAYGVKGTLISKQREMLLNSTFYSILDTAAQILQLSISKDLNLAKDENQNLSGTFIINQAAKTSLSEMSEYFMNLTKKLSPEVQINNGIKVLVFFQSQFKYVSDDYTE